MYSVLSAIQEPLPAPVSSPDAPFPPVGSAEMPLKIRILLADGHRLVRQGVSSLLAREEGMEVVAEAEDSESALDLARRLLPDVVVTEVNLPGADGIEAARRMAAEKLPCRILFLTGSADRESVTGAFSSGAQGYLLKDADFRCLVDGIRTVHGSRTYLGPNIPDLLVRDIDGNGAGVGNGTERLTAREKEILRLFAEGNSSKDIAFILGISNKTVDTFRRHCMTKLQLKSAADLIRFAIRNGMAPL